MKRMFGPVIGLLLLIAAAVGSPRIAAADFALTDTDRVLFAGGTRVWPTSCGALVESFVRVRYPGLKARFWHVGPQTFSTLADMSDRVMRHVALCNPTIVVLSFGLYDGELQPFEGGRRLRFRAELTNLIDQCEKAGAHVVLLSPNCPDISEKAILRQSEYDNVVAQYAATMRDLAEPANRTFVDWYAASTQESMTARGIDARLTVDGLIPGPAMSYVGAELLLQAWSADPLESRISVDWSSKSVTTSPSTAAKAAAQDETAMRVHVPGMAMPWAFTGRAGRIEAAEIHSPLCRLSLQVQGAPATGLVVSVPGQRGATEASESLASGVSLQASPALLRSKSVANLMNLIRRKNKTLNDLDRWLSEPFAEPEYADANRKYIEAMVADIEATDKVIDRTPRATDVVFELRLAESAP